MIKNIGISLICLMLILSNVFVFTTLPTVSADPRENICPTAINPTIANQSKYIDIDVGWFNITVYDEDGNNTYGNITCSNGDTSSWSGQPNGTKSLELDTLDYYTNYTVWLNFMDDTCAVNKTYWFVTQGLPPSTSINSVSPYWHNAVPEVNLRATNSTSVDNVTLYYRWGMDNGSWGGWTKWISVNNPDDCGNPWAWTFDCPGGSGYYEFYSIGANSSNYEGAPDFADARCHINKSVWVRFGNQHVGCYSNELFKDPELNHNYIQGSNFTCLSDGIADSMCVWIRSAASTPANVTCAVYTADEGILVGYTEEKTIGYMQDWVTFDFIGEPTNLVMGTKYLLVVWGDNGYIRYDDDTTNDFNGFALNYTGTFPDNITGYEHIHDFVVSIYCRYTESEPNPNPLNNYPYPANNSINIPFPPATLNITVNDANGYLMNITFRTNESGVWQDADTNSSLGNGTYYCLNTSWIDSYSTKYWWSVNTSDSYDGWDNDTYCFTTRAIYTPDAPSSFTASADNRTKITLTWTDDAEADSTRVEWSLYEDFTWNVGNHNELYNGSAETATHTGLDASQTVYYKAWSYNITGNVWSNGITAYEITDSNSVPTASLISPSPNGTTGVELSPILNVSLSDSDFDSVSVTFYYFSDNSVIGTNIVVGGSGYAAVVWSGLVNNTVYRWYVTVNDSYDNVTEPDGFGSFWSFTTGSIANNPPFTPSHPNPVNHATSIDINVNLNWLGGDQDCGDIVTYDVYFGTTTTPLKVSSNQSITIYDPSTMNFNTKYYWRIVAWDNHEANITGPIWDFTTLYVNQPPNTPYNPTPEDGKKSINIDQDLHWSGGDPDAGDTATYDVYFGYILPLQKVASNISTLTYNTGTLTNSLTYFWEIVAWDNHGLSTNGPRWYFTTINATNNPPNKPNKPSGITSGKIGTTHSYSSSTTDPNGDYVYYWFDWGDGINSGWDGPHNSGDNVTLAHSWVRVGTYPIKVKVKDIHGNESVWSDPLVISIPKTKISNLILQLLYRIFEHFPLIEKIIQRFPIFEKILNIYYN